MADLNHVTCVVEKRLDLVAECSVVVARGRDGACVHLPLQVNTHVGGILARTEVFPGNLDADLSARAIQAAEAIAETPALRWRPVWSSSSSSSRAMARWVWWLTKWRRGLTTVGTTALRPATSPNLICKCAP